jgi:hypothetical protein
MHCACTITPCSSIHNGQRIQYAPLPDAPPPAQDSTHTEGNAGTLLYNTRAVDLALLGPLSSLSSQFSSATTATLDTVSHLLDYCNTLFKSTIMYYASDMQLNIHSDSGYLSKPKANSRIGVYFYLCKTTNLSATPLTNGPLLCHTKVLTHVLSSIAEAEFCAIFVNAKEGTVIRTPFLKWATNKTPRNSKLTTPLQTESSITQSKKALQSHGHEILLGQIQG